MVWIDNTPPTVIIKDPTPGQIIETSSYAIQGTAADDIALAEIEVSTDGGQTWGQADGLETWTFSWAVPVEEYTSYTLMARAVDQAGFMVNSQPVEVVVNTAGGSRIYLPLIMR